MTICSTHQHDRPIGPIGMESSTLSSTNMEPCGAPTNRIGYPWFADHPLLICPRVGLFIFQVTQPVSGHLYTCTFDCGELTLIYVQPSKSMYPLVIFYVALENHPTFVYGQTGFVAILWAMVSRSQTVKLPER